MADASSASLCQALSDLTTGTEDSSWKSSAMLVSVAVAAAGLPNHPLRK